MEKEIVLPQEISAATQNGTITIRGPQGMVSRFFKIVQIRIEDKKIKIALKGEKRKQKKLVNTTIAHIKNAIKGVIEPWIYKLKICYSHFPINASVSNNALIIKNFLGERKPRSLAIPKDVKVELQGDKILVKSCDIEKAGQFASNLELLTRIVGYDRRVFQDGIFIFEKPKGR